MDSSYNEFDAFNEVPRDNSITKEYYKVFSPISSLESSNNVIEYNVLPSSFAFINLSKLRIKTMIQIYRVNGNTPMDPTDQVSPINNVLDSLFRSVEFQLNDVEFENYVGANHSYKSYLNLILDKTSPYMESIGFIRGFYPDSTGMLGLVAPDSGNLGVSKRYAIFCKNGEYEFTSFLDIDPCTTSKFLPNGIGIKLKLFLNKPEFFLKHGIDVENNSYAFRLKTCNLYISYIDPHIDIYKAYNNAISNTMAIYPYIKSSIRSYVISTGVRSKVLDNIITHTPDEIIICMSTNSAYVGSFNENPFNFETFGVNYISLTYEGHELNGYSMAPDFDREVLGSPHNKLADTYINMYLKEGRHSKGGFITPQKLNGGYFILKYTLNNSLKYNTAKESNAPGLACLSIGFAEQTEKPISVIIYTRTRSFFGIDGQRTVYLDVENK